jgi:hypothetical protein
MTDVLNRAAETAVDVPASPEERPKTAFTPRLTQSIAMQPDGKVLTVIRNGFRELPGALTRPGEDLEACQARGLQECVGLGTAKRVRIYEGPNTVVYAIDPIVPALGARGSLIKAWLTWDQLIANTARPALMKVVFEALKRAEVVQSNVISKDKSGRILYAIQYDTFADGKWKPHEAHFVHALNGEDALSQFRELIPAGVKVNIIGAAPAIGFHQEEEGVLLG